MLQDYVTPTSFLISPLGCKTECNGEIVPLYVTIPRQRLWVHENTCRIHSTRVFLFYHPKLGAHNRVLDHFRREKASRQVNESEAGYDVIGSMRFSEPTTEDELVHGEM